MTGTPPGASAPITAPALDDAKAVGPFNARRLTQGEYDNTVRDLLGDKTAPGSAFPPESRGPSGFLTPGTVGGVEVTSFEAAAQSLAAAAAGHLDELAPCAKGSEEAVCAHAFVANFGKRAFRRPVAEDEAAALDALYKKLRAVPTSFSHAAAVQALLEAMLQMPQFLYHWEDGLAETPDGTGLVPVKPYALAARLSYFLTSSMPDAQLFGLADSGKIVDPSVLESEAKRLLASPAAADTVKSFHRQWLDLGRLETLSKDTKVYPLFNDALAKAMANEVDAFAARAVLEDGHLSALLTGTTSFVNGQLAKVYGLDGVTAAEPMKTTLPAGRAGVLTLAGFLTANASPYGSSPIKRGHVVRESFICQHLQPADGVDTNPPPDDPKKTTRETVDDMTIKVGGSCVGCHTLMNPLGYGLETFDGLGQARAQEKGKTIDSTGVIAAVGQERSFADAPSLAKALLETEEVQACVALQWSRFALGRAETSAEAKSIAFVQSHFRAGGLDFKEMIAALVKSRTFRYGSAQ